MTSICRHWPAALLLALLTLLVACTEPALQAAANPVTARSAFEQLKSLVGAWRGKATHGETASDTTVTYRLVGAGSTVMETLFPGTAHEMVTMYHLDGDKLMLTHYCAAGNQPRMVLDLQKSTPVLLVFEFAGGTNLDPAKDPHMHAGRLKFIGANKLEAEWDNYQQGKQAGVAKFTLQREPAKK